MRKPDLQRIGNYRVIQEIGSGGFARVYLGVHDYLETKAAIKVLRMNQGLTSEEKRNFLIEARTIARLRHPHIVRILDFNVEHNMPYLVMEYAPAGSLSTLYPAKSVLQLRTILSYTKQVAAALQFAHERHIVHCDVKPENMLVSEQNTILLSDFGIAVVFNSNLRTQDVAVGTMYYMAPEQYKGKPEPASDQYSLAVVVYLWLCGQLPFKGKNAIEMYHLHATVPPCPPREINPRISRDVERVVLTALAKRPEQRFPDVQTFARALEKALLEPKQVAKAPAARLSPAGKNEDRTPRIAEPQLEALLPAPSSILPVATPAMPVLSTPIQDAPHAPLPPGQLVLPGEQFDAPSQEVTLRADIALPPTETALPPEDHDAPIVSSIAYPSMNVSASQPPLTLGQRILFTHSDHANWVLALAWSPNGHAIASGSWDTTVQVWGVATGMLLLTYQGHSQPVKSVSWAPGGGFIASGSWDTTVQVWDATTGEALPTRFQHNAQVETVAWAPDSQRIASAGHEDTIYVWGAFNTRIITTYRGHQGPVWALTWSPDGQHIASAGQDHTVHLWNAATGKELFTYTYHKQQVTTVSWSPDGQCIASGDAEGKVSIWSATDGKTLFYYDEGETIKALNWSPDSTCLASAAQQVRLWQINSPHSAALAFTYKGHVGGVNAIAWSPDRQTIASAGDDRTVQVWLPG